MKENINLFQSFSVTHSLTHWRSERLLYIYRERTITRHHTTSSIISFSVPISVFMASSAKHFFLLFLFTILSSQHIHARESQFFNKIPSNNDLKEAQLVPTKEEPVNKPGQEPNFIPENENGGYGLYDHESGQLPPATTTTTNGETYKSTTNLPYNNEAQVSNPKYLPKNYNTVSYVTKPEGYKSAVENNNNNFYNGENNYYSSQQASYSTNGNGDNFYNSNGYNSYNGQQQGMSDTRYAQQGYTTTGGNSYNYYNGENSFNGQQQGMSGAKFAQNGYTTTSTGDSYNYFNGGNPNSFQKQGMSDTRFLENGKFYHEVSLEKNNFNAYENPSAFGSSNYGNNENSFENQNSVTAYQNQDFQDEEGMP